MIEVNLHPDAHRTRGLALNASAVANRFKTVLQDKYLLGAVATVCLAAFAIIFGHLSQSSRTAELDARAAEASRDSTKFATILAARTRAQASRDSVYQQLAIIRSIDNMRYTWAHLLEEINIALPAYTWLTTVSQTSPVTTTATTDTAARRSPLKPATTSSTLSKAELALRRARADSLFHGHALPTRFRISGQTIDIQALTLFMKNLEASPFIRNVQLARSDLVTSNGKEVTEFQLDAESEPPNASLIQTVPLAISVR